jgi:hypothetical protein
MRFSFSWHFAGAIRSDDADEAEARLESSRRVLNESIQQAKAVAQREILLAHGEVARGRRVIRNTEESVDLVRKVGHVR